MKVLVTGAGGFVGRNLIKFLSKNNIYVYALINKSNGENKKKIFYIKKNINKLKKIPHKIDCLIHLAVKNPEDTSGPRLFKENIEITRKILELSKGIKLKKIIFLSSIAVYENIKGSVIKENMLKKSPDSYYSKSKFMCEEMIRNIIGKNISTWILRAPSIIGNKSRFNAISDIKQNILDGKQIKINNPNYKYNRILHVETLNKFILKILKNKKKINTTIHIGSSYPLKFKNIILLMFKKLNKKPHINLLANNKKFVLNLSKAKKYKFKPMSVKKTLLKYLNG